MKKVLFAIAILLIAGSALAGDSASQARYEVNIHENTCFTDNHFYDYWETKVNGVIRLGQNPRVLNMHDIEVWSAGIRLISVPAGVDLIDVTGIDNPRFKLVNRRTLEWRWLLMDPHTVVSECYFYPPPDGTAYVWKTGRGFVLQEVPHWEPSGGER
jgi:hypothetical protein